MNVRKLQREVESVWKGPVKFDCITGRARTETDLVASFYRHMCERLNGKLRPEGELEVALDHGLKGIPRKRFDVIIGKRVKGKLEPGIVIEMKFDIRNGKALKSDRKKLRPVQEKYGESARAYLCVTYTPDQHESKKFRVSGWDRDFFRVLVGLRPHRRQTRDPGFNYAPLMKTEWKVQD